jgi:hypothetical protein
MLRKQQKETAAPTRSCPVGPDCTLERRINFPGSSLAMSFQAPEGTMLLPVPSRLEQVQVAVIIGPAGPTKGYPREENTPTHLLAEGRLSNDRRVWIVYLTMTLQDGAATATNRPSLAGKRALHHQRRSKTPAIFVLLVLAHSQMAALGFFDVRAERQGQSVVIRF